MAMNVLKEDQHTKTKLALCLDPTVKRGCG